MLCYRKDLVEYTEQRRADCQFLCVEAKVNHADGHIFCVETNLIETSIMLLCTSFMQKLTPRNKDQQHHAVMHIVYVEVNLTE